ncbi:hypothetical protein NUH86_01565 [Sphingobium sp. JS3065]|uniref:hypothetical protein n=1 Tax=Sphingobium sp. JS3065 TaxID=2970925 RepID=UPI002264FB97|nr:hypothetical protein [Sphingobium sp. JS3065]UZW55518.1 hypothetical protein NUH86_01565 [Sphingobium sp. JS3065]
MADADSNAVAAEQHVKRIVGPTILMGDGAYFDFEQPDATGMTIEDYAWSLAGSNRFRGQNRLPSGKRCLFNVAQHCVLLAWMMETDGHSAQAVFEGLMHESDEVAWGDFPGPAKSLLPPEVKALIKRAGDAIDRHFGVTSQFKDLVKQYDIRMLATEKRDLMPHSGADQWSWTRGYEPFRFRIEPWTAETSADQFIRAYRDYRNAAHG